MSKAKLSAGSLVGDALSFTTSNLGSVVRIAWFPLFAATALMLALYYYFLGPAIIELVDILRESMQHAASGKGAPPVDPANDPMLRAITDMGLGRLSAFYSSVYLIGILGYAIPTVAYARMVVTGDVPRGLIYFKLGGREISLTITYVALGIITYVFMVAVIIAAMIPIFGVIAATAAGGKGAEPGGMAVALLFVFLIPAIIAGLAAPLAKFGLAIPVASVEGGLGLGEAWEMSSGNFWPLFWGMILAFLVMLALMLVATFVAVIIVIPVGMVGASMNAASGLWLTVAVGVAIYIIFTLVIYSISLAIFTALFSVAYKELKGTESATA